MRYLEAARDAGLRTRRRLLEPQLPASPARGRASRTCSRSASTASSPSERGLRGKPAPDTFLAGAARAGRRARAGRGLRGRPRRRAGGPGRRLRLRRRRRPGRPGATRCGPRRRRRRRATSPSCWSAMIEPARVRGRAVGASPRASSTSTCWRRPSRSSRSPTATSGCAATSTRASRTACPGTTSTASTRCARCPTPRPATATRRTGQTVDQRHQRQADPAAGRRRAVRRALRHAARHERVLDLRAGVLRRDVEWSSPAGRAVRVRSTRLVSFVQRADRGDPLRGGAARRRAARGRAVGAGRQRAACRTQPSDPRAAAALRAPLVGEYHAHHDARARCSCTARARAACGWRRRWTT